MCRLQRASFVEGFYYVPRIDKDLLQRYHDGIMWSDACVGGTICTHILKGDIDKAYAEFMWYLNLLGDDFYIEWHNHGIEAEDRCNTIKEEWANAHGVPIIACTDAHFYKKEDADAHKTLLCIQYGNWFDNPTFGGFQGDGYWLMDEDELIERYPIEYLNNTQLVVNRCEGDIIKFGDTMPPKFQVPQWFIDQVNMSRTTEVVIDKPDDMPIDDGQILMEPAPPEPVAEVAPPEPPVTKPKFVMKTIGGK